MTSTTVYVSRGKPAKPGLIITPAADSPDSASRFRPDIEGLRAVAVVLVVLYHAGVTVFGGGYVGVDVFFVISGFLITTQLYGELQTRHTISVSRFYARRATRLLPASTTVLVATLVAAYCWLPPTRFPSTALDALTSTFYGINWRLAAEGVDYLNAGAPPSPLQHFWSLAVEEQFYLVWPLLLLASSLAWRWRRTRLSRSAIVLTLLAAGGLSLYGSVTQTRDAAPWAYFGAHTRAWELALGALIAILAPALARLPAAIAAGLTWLGLAAVVAAALLFTDKTPFPGYAAALPVGGAGLIIAGGCAAAAGGVVAVLRLAPLQWLGKLSYSWYLWHWPILVIAPAALHRDASLGLNLTLAGASLAVAAGSYFLVENPVRSRKGLKTRPVRGISLGLALSLCAAALAYGGGRLTPGLGTGGPATDTAAVMAAASDPAGQLTKLIADSTGTDALPSNLTPTLAAVAKDSPAVYAAGCHLSFTATKNPECAYGDPASPTTVALVGDSHAAQWFPAFERIARQRHWRLVVHTKSACPAASVLVYQSALNRAYNECVQWRDQTLEAVRAAKPAMVVLTSNGTDTGGLVDNPADPDKAWTDAWIASLRKVKQDGTKLVVLSDTPYPKANVPDCVSEHTGDVGECVRGADTALVLPKRRQMVAAAAAAEGATVIDPTAWFCTAKTCPVVVGNILVYRDDSHMTTTYASVLAPVLGAQLP
ncbi:acyltransferase family protein [Dactylosporangium sp. CA-139066]|uniref:acyltransferase family protein n=1 Tax=Dactylosporangium sp. CA-139066 TaxID=3239930 RepID=UPI003D9177B8